MARQFRVRTQMQEFEAPSLSQLKLLVRMGIIGADDQLQELPERSWVAAADHPALREHFARSTNTPGSQGNAPRPRHLKARVRRQGSEPKPIPAAPIEVGGIGGDSEGTKLYPIHAIMAHSPHDGSACMWVQTDDDTLEIRGIEVLERLLELGVVQAHHTISLHERGPFEVLSGHPSLTQLFQAQSSSRGGSDRVEPKRETSNVIMLTESEITYLNGLDDDEPQRRSEVSNVIALSEFDLEPFESEDELNRFFDREPDEDLFIILEEEDLIIEEIDPGHVQVVTAPSPLPPTDSPWEHFRVAMNQVAQSRPVSDSSRELTWDVFRSMMARKPAEGTERGPSERTWQRFRSRIVGRRQETTPPRAEHTWDRFRSLMTQGQGDNTWQRFVHYVEAKDDEFGIGQAIAGEAQIKSRVHVVVDPTGPSIQVNGLPEE